MRRFLSCVIVALSLPISARAEAPCPRSSAFAPLHLPRLSAALATDAEAVVVALGSSSTEGVAASSPSHSYPAVLQAELSRLFPGGHIAVINRGIGGQDAVEELARLDSDVIAVQPQLVIWQVGANGAMRHADPLAFLQEVTKGVDRLKALNIDVILMDNQRSPRIISAVGHAVLEHELALVAGAAKVNLFSRGGLMDQWAAQGLPLTRFLAPDNLHHNDLGYACVARALASAIAGAVTEPVAVAASH